MLDTKVKIKQQVPVIYELLTDQKAILNPYKLDFIEKSNHFRYAVSVIYSTLVNFTSPIAIKLNALLLLKRLFQSAHPVMLEEATRILPVLANTCRKAKQQPKQGDQKYFLLGEMRAVDEPEKSQKYVRFSMEIIKQWSEYMEDCQVGTSPYIDMFNETSRRGVDFPPYFLYFTMKDYVEFMMNWMRRKKKNEDFKDKVQVYMFLSIESNYTKHLSNYKATLSQNSDTLLYEAYSILINHSIPIPVKFMALRSLKDFYQQANLLYCEKAAEIMVPFFTYIVDLHLRGETTPERYFQKIEKRLGVEQTDSRNYIYIILQIIKQWDKYNSKAAVNPYFEVAAKIDKRGLLGVIERSYFTQQDFMKFAENQSLGKHREPEYIVPPAKPKSNVLNTQMKAELDRSQRLLADLKRREQDYLNQLKMLKQQLDEKERLLRNSSKLAPPQIPIAVVTEPFQRVVFQDESSLQLSKKKDQLRAMQKQVKQQVQNKKAPAQEVRYLRHNQSQKRFESTYKLSDIVRLREQKLLRRV